MDISCKEWFLTIFGAFLGSIGGLAIAMFLEWLKTPKLSLEIAEHSDQPDDVGRVTRFLYINVVNRPLPNFLGRFLIREAAVSCDAQIEFLRLDGSSVFRNRFQARWSNSLMPPQLADDAGRLFNEHLATLRYRTVYPNRPEKIDIAIKRDDEDVCYVFNNESYSDGFLNQNRQLSRDRYRVRVTANAGHLIISRTWVLRNDWPRLDFCLENEATASRG